MLHVSSDKNPELGLRPYSSGSKLWTVPGSDVRASSPACSSRLVVCRVKQLANLFSDRKGIIPKLERNQVAKVLIHAYAAWLQVGRCFLRHMKMAVNSSGQ